MKAFHTPVLLALLPKLDQCLVAPCIKHSLAFEESIPFCFVGNVLKENLKPSPYSNNSLLLKVYTANDFADTGDTHCKPEPATTDIYFLNKASRFGVGAVGVK